MKQYFRNAWAVIAILALGASLSACGSTASAGGSTDTDTTAGSDDTTSDIAGSDATSDTGPNDVWATDNAPGSDTAGSDAATSDTADSDTTPSDGLASDVTSTADGTGGDANSDPCSLCLQSNCAAQVGPCAADKTCSDAANTIGTCMKAAAGDATASQKCVDTFTALGSLEATMITCVEAHCKAECL